jgi:hypothetical protein
VQSDFNFSFELVRCNYRSNGDVAERRAMTSRSLDASSPPSTAASSRSSVSACGHNNAGQELCYLCHQRARRNVFLNLAEERRRKEEEESQLLKEFQQYRDAVEMQKEQVGDESIQLNETVRLK